MATYKVNKDGKAQSGLKAGDVVVTGGGTYTITGVNADGSYKSTLTDKNTTTGNYSGSYASATSSSSGGGGSSSSSGSSSSGSSGYYSPTGGGSGGQYTGTNYHQDAINAAKSGDWDGVKSALSAREEKVGQTGENYGKSSADIYDELLQQYGPKASGGFTYSDAPSYSDPYDSRIDKMLDSILNRDTFSYDATQDPLYEQYKDQYLREGQRAMEDTLGQVSARTGGLASSYATSAAQQANQLYAQQLSDKIPELYQMAYQMYLDDIDLRAQDLGLLQNASNTAYNRYRDTMADWRNDRDFAYGQYRDDIADNRYDTEWSYGVGRDQIEDERYTKNQAYTQAADMLSSGVMPDDTLLKQAGISSQQAAAWLAGTTSNRGSGGGGGGSSNGSSQTKPRLSAAQIEKALNSGMMNAELMDGYEYYYGQRWDGGELAKNGFRNLPDYGRELMAAMQNGNITQKTLADALEEAVDSRKLTQKDAEWILDFWGVG